MHYLGRLFFLLFFVVISLTFVNKTEAATCTWTGGAGDGLIHTAGNWSGCTPGQTPQPTDSVVINTGSAAIAWNSSASSTISALTLGSSYSGTLTLSRSLTVTNALTINGGTFSVSGTNGVGVGSLVIDGGIFSLGTGTLTLSGASAVTSGSLTSSATGILNIQNDLTVSSGASVAAGDLRTLNTGSIGGEGTLTATTFTLSHGTTGNSTTTLAGNVSVSGNCLLNTSTNVQSVLKLSSHTLSCGGTLNLLTSLIQNAATYLHTESGTLTVTGLTTLAAEGALASTTVLIDGGTGTINLNGGLTIRNSPLLASTNHNALFYGGPSGTLTIGGNFVLRNNSDGKGGKVLFDGGGKTINVTGAILAESLSADQLIFNAGHSGTLTVSGTSTIFKVDGTTIGATTTFNGQSKDLVFTNGVTVQKDTGDVGEVFYTPSTSSNTYDLTLNKAGGFLSFATTSTITGGLTNTAGTLYINGTTTITGTISNSDTIVASSTHPLKKSSSLALDRGSYTLGTHTSLTLTLTDLNRNTVGTTSQSIIVNIITNADAEPVTLTETGVATGIFTGSLSLAQIAPTAGNGTLEANENTTISVSYTDNQDSTDTGSDSASFSIVSSGGGAVIFFGGGVPLTISSSGTTPIIPPSQITPTIPPENTPISGGTGKVVTGPFSFGYEGEQVKILQEMLARDTTLYPEALITGYYGPLTKKAVGRFQERYGLAKLSDDFYGLAGPITRAKLNEIFGKPAESEPVGVNQGLIEELKKQIEILQNQVATLLQKKLLELQNQLPR